MSIARRAPSASIAGWSLSIAVTRQFSASRSANGPEPAEQVGDRFRFPGIHHHQLAKRFLAHFRRLQKGAGRKLDDGLAHADGRDRRLRDHLAMTGDARDRPGCRDTCQRRRGVSGPAGPSRARRYRGRSSFRSPECRAACRAARALPRSSRRSRWRPSSTAPAPDSDRSGRSHARASAEKPTSTICFVPWRACSTARRRPSPCASISSSTSVVDTGCFECGDDQTAFPGAVGRLRPLLGGAAAADSEMRTERLIRSGDGSMTRSRCRRSGWPGTAVGVDGFARQRVGNEDRLARDIRDAVAAMSDIGDVKPVDHK